jgi:hypothetical protein
MKLVAVYHPDGRIAAGAIIDGQNRGPIPVPGEGMQRGMFEVPANARELRIDELCRRMRIDVAAQRLAPHPAKNDATG